MKKKSTLASLLLLLSFCGRLQAQYWQDIGPDTTQLPGWDQNYPGQTQLLVGPRDKLYYVNDEALSSYYAPSITVQTFDGTNWVHLDPGIQNYSGFKAAIDPSGNIFLAVKTDTGVAVYKHGSSWSLLGTNPIGLGSVNAMAVTSTGIPYYTITSNNIPTVFRYNGSGFTSLDTTGLGINYPGANVQLYVDRQDSLYLTFVGNPVSGSLLSLYVKKYTGSGWRQIGAPLPATDALKSLAFDSNNMPYAISATGNTSAGYYLQLEKLSAGNWIAVGPTVPSLPDVTSAYPSGYAFSGLANLRIGVADTPIVAFTQVLPNGVSYNIDADKFDGTSWKTMGANLPDSAEYYTQDLEMSTDSAGHPFLRYLPLNGAPRVVQLSTAPTKPTAYITFPSAGVIGRYGEADFDPGAVSTNTDSSDPITYTIADTTIATIVNGKVHPLKTGNTTITANQAADSNFFAAVPATAQLSIVQGIQQLAFPGIPEKKVGDSDFHAIAASSTGLPLVFSGSDSTIATVSPDGLIHIRGFGQIDVYVYATGDSLWQQTQSLWQILTILPADSSSGEPGSDSAATKKMTAYLNGGRLIVTVSVPQAQSARLQLFSVAGTLVYNREVQLNAGINQFQITDQSWHHAIYYLRCAGPDLSLIQSLWIP